MKRKKSRMTTIFGILAVLFIIWTAWGYFAVANVEQLSYKVIDDSKEYEIRQYDDYLVAEAEVSGEYRDTLSSGFRIVADYIFGNNTKKKDVAMTAPVIEKAANEEVAMTTPVIISENEKVAMTTPVISTEGEETRKIQFVMPAKYTMETLPTPNDDRVKITKIKGEKVAVLQFTWWLTGERVAKKKAELLKYLERDGLQVKELRSAGYNPPTTPPFMLRNEIWAVLAE